MRGLLVVLLSLTAAGAMADNAWYAGAGVGATNIRTGSNLTTPVVELDSWEPGFQVFGGYKLGTLWALEFGYVDFGESEDEDPDSQPGGTSRKYSITGLYLNGQYHIPIASRVSLDLDAGWLFGEAEDEKNILNPCDTCAADKASYDDNGAMLGLAFTWRTTDSFYLRGSANYFLIDFDKTVKNPWRLGIDVIWDF